MTPQHKRITYIALATMCMPKLTELFLQFNVLGSNMIHFNDYGL